jgi:hypothetical protein
LRLQKQAPPEGGTDGDWGVGGGRGVPWDCRAKKDAPGGPPERLDRG